MPFVARAYIASIIFLGLAALLSALVCWKTSDPVRFGVYLLVALLTSGLKLQWPRIKGTLSINLLVVLLCIAELSWSETLLIASASFTAQYLWRAGEKRDKVKLLFNLGNAALSASISYSLYALPSWSAYRIPEGGVLVAVAAVYFISNTGTVASVVALTERRQMRQVWRECYFWAFPYFCFSAAAIWLVTLFNRQYGWHASMLGFPVVLVVHRGYSAYLDRLRAEARQAEVKAQFLASMSHEIRTPIQGVIGMSMELLNGPLSKEEREYASTIHSSAMALLTIINDILDFSKIEAGKFEIRSAPIRLRDVVNESISIVRQDAAHKPLDLRTEVDASLPEYVVLDRGRVRQVLLNLLSNAVKFTTEGAVTLRVTPQVEGDMLRVEVIDTGVGISEQGCLKLFEPFTQLDATDSRSFGGTGLGLSISRKLVELMGGRIGVVSNVGTGSTFWFCLPFTPCLEGAAEGPPSALFPVPGAAARGRILLAEDNAVNRLVVLKLLERLGYEAEAVSDGRRAVERVLSEEYSLVLMDCYMPVMGGLDAARAIRRQEKRRRTPVVALTGAATPGEEARCTAAGMDGVLTKPVDLAQLIRVLETWHREEAVRS